LGESVAQVQRLVFAKEQGGAVGGVVLAVATGDDRIDPVIATALKDEEHLFVAGMTIRQEVAGQAKRAQYIEAKRSASQAAGLEEVASLHVHDDVFLDNLIFSPIGTATAAWIISNPRVLEPAEDMRSRLDQVSWGVRRHLS